LAGYEVFDDPYCYPDTFVLKNKAGIKDAASLEAFELEMSTLRAEESLPDGNFSPAHYRKVHRHLFQDVYSWAGRSRTVRTSKGGNPFCYPEYIDSAMNQLFKNLASGPFTGGASADEFITAAADFLAELNAIHPFRDGNGRAQLSFLYLLAARAGHALALDKIERETFLPAMIASFSGDTRALKEELRKLLA
jgi:cell filamentation protein